MDTIWTYIQNNGTKVLAYLVGTLAIIAQSPDIIPASQLKWWMLAIAVLTYWRGTGNTDKIAAAVVQQHANAMAASAATGDPVVLAKPGQLSESVPVKDLKS